MNTRIYSEYTRTSTTSNEHTPIRDFPAFLASKKKAAKLKKIKDTFAYASILILGYLLLKMGGA